MAQLDPDSLADAMEKAMPQAWQDVKKTPFPGGDPGERRPLFLAVSRALLSYLRENQGDLVTRMDLSAGGAQPVTNAVTNLVLNVKP